MQTHFMPLKMYLCKQLVISIEWNEHLRREVWEVNERKGDKKSEMTNMKGKILQKWRAHDRMITHLVPCRKQYKKRKILKVKVLPRPYSIEIWIKVLVQLWRCCLYIYIFAFFCTSFIFFTLVIIYFDSRWLSSCLFNVFRSKYVHSIIKYPVLKQAKFILIELQTFF